MHLGWKYCNIDWVVFEENRDGVPYDLKAGGRELIASACWLHAQFIRPSDIFLVPLSGLGYAFFSGGRNPITGGRYHIRKGRG